MYDQAYVFCVDIIRKKSDYRHRALIDRFLLNIQTECAYCQVPNEYLNMIQLNAGLQSVTYSERSIHFYVYNPTVLNAIMQKLITVKQN
jgi:hypothetical protein